MDAISGREMEIESTSLTIHDEHIELKIVELQAKLKNVFHGEHGNKVIRASYQRGHKSFFFNAGFEENLYNEVVEYVREVAEKEYRPLVFNFHNFLSFTQLRGVNSDTVGD